MQWFYFAPIVHSQNEHENDVRDSWPNATTSVVQQHQQNVVLFISISRIHSSDLHHAFLPTLLEVQWNHFRNLIDFRGISHFSGVAPLGSGLFNIILFSRTAKDDLIRDLRNCHVTSLSKSRPISMRSDDLKISPIYYRSDVSLSK